MFHDVLQTASGWTDSHLHRFTLPGEPFGHHTQGILTPFDVEEGDEGTLESELRIDQLLAESGDSLLYTYDFGDQWAHTIMFEEMLPLTTRSSGTPPGRWACTGSSTRSMSTRSTAASNAWPGLRRRSSGCVSTQSPLALLIAGVGEQAQEHALWRSFANMYYHAR
ncbi:hypothetical protein GY21_09830 [Cryobacterium roopkundense]|uniref:Plasmid pRiA4b Orf3-like domain-containing protein n=1 Tax=Cryobacterium roopkundense TaxID=1001240 RepID=A0A099JD16_9MICO|nr:hypothetical protein GY21_09830 [Cryobacterium roopkundense]MBB5639930.1 hypothetical protein [Cryobacterium roopkundense]